MIFNSAGHDLVKDPGAVSNGYTEAQLTHELRNLINKRLNNIGAHFVGDRDNESLGQYLERIKPGEASVVHEVHFNSYDNKSTGVEVVIPDRHTSYEYEAAKEIALAISCLTGIPLRGKRKNGVITESETARKKLAIMREQGINLLTEVCFISNPEDLERYFATRDIIAERIGDILKRYDDMIS